jgi:rhodanese-related sulfurtransferase
MDAPTPEPKRRVPGVQVFGETLLVAIIGAVLAFAANEISPRGLKLSQNYFLTGADEFATNRLVAPASANSSSNPLASTNGIAAAPTLISVPRLNEKGLQAIDTAQALRFFQDARRRKDLLVFVDARSEENYQLGHIPGAYELDVYHSEKYLPAVIPLCEKAELVVVYCTGVDCEDSELGALLLRNAGISSQKIFVFVGGITEWTSRKFPVETGARQGAKNINTDP